MFERDPSTATLGKEILPLELGYLPEFFQKKGEVEINFTQSVRERTLREIKEAIAGDDSINGASFTDECLLAFLSSRKYDVSKTLAQLKICIIFRRKNSTIFKSPSFEVLSVFLTSELFTFLPWRCQDGCTLIIVQLDKYNSIQHPLDAIKQFYALSLLQSLREPMTQVNGFKIIFDLSTNFEIFKVVTPQNLHLLYYGSQVVFPGRFKNFHLVNMGVIGRTVWQMMKIFLPKKLKKRVQNHATYDTLLDFFPKAVLPEKYGGDLEDYDMTKWLKKISSPEELKWLSSIF